MEKILKRSADIHLKGQTQSKSPFYCLHLIFFSISRRYSDFYDLQQRVKETYNNLGKLTFPGKKTFHNMERSTLEKRMKMLNDYLQILLQSAISDVYNKLSGMLLTFLEPGEYDKSSGPFVKTVSFFFFFAIEFEINWNLREIQKFSVLIIHFQK